MPTNETFFKGVYCLQPGHYFTYEDGKLEVTRYFEPNFTGDTDKSFDEVVDEIEKVMKESVEMHKRSVMWRLDLIFQAVWTPATWLI